MSLKAGKLRHYVTLERLFSVIDSNGDVNSEWQGYARVYAAMEPLNAREFIAANAEQSKVTGKATIRYRGDVVAADAIFYKGKRYEIQGVLEDPDSMREYQTLPFAEGVRVDPEVVS